MFAIPITWCVPITRLCRKKLLASINFCRMASDHFNDTLYDEQIPETITWLNTFSIPYKFSGVYRTTNNSIWLLIWILCTYLYEASNAKLLAQRILRSPTFPLLFPMENHMQTPLMLIICLYCLHPIWFTSFRCGWSTILWHVLASTIVIVAHLYALAYGIFWFLHNCRFFWRCCWVLRNTKVSHPPGALSIWKINGFE